MRFNLGKCKEGSSADGHELGCDSSLSLRAIDEEFLVIYSPDCSPLSMQARIERKTRALQLLQGISESEHGA